MDQYFKENDGEDPTLLWQYFGSSDGVYRVYPGKITGQSIYLIIYLTNLIILCCEKSKI